MLYISYYISNDIKVQVEDSLLIMQNPPASNQHSLFNTSCIYMLRNVNQMTLTTVKT